MNRSPRLPIADGKPPKVTIREVAALAGVSMMTVSRVMRNEPQVAAETRHAVQSAIESLHYVPLQSARNLSSSIAKVLGLVIAHSKEDVPLKQDYEYASALHLGAMQSCAERGYGLMVVHLNRATSVQNLVSMFHARQVGGFVLAAPVTEAAGMAAAMQQHDITYSAINPWDLKAAPQWVAANDRAAIRALTLHLADFGHESIAYVGYSSRWRFRACVERRKGFDEAMQQAKLALRPEWNIPVKRHTFEEGLSAGRRLLRLVDRPTAVQCASDELAAGIIMAAHELGMRLPGDLSVTGFDDYGLAHKTWPLLTTAHHPVEDMSACAAMQVIDTIEKQAVANLHFDCPLVIRGSVAAPPARNRR